jgi:hypothetical protein
VWAVVDPDDEAIGGRHARGLVADAAPDIEHRSSAEARQHLAVTGIMQRQQGIGSGALHRTLAGQPA